MLSDCEGAEEGAVILLFAHSSASSRRIYALQKLDGLIRAVSDSGMTAVKILSRNFPELDHAMLSEQKGLQ
jgi:hypothetical protein